MAVQWVVKLSKLCNLRCRYCYEFPWLGDAKRMAAHDVDPFLRRVAEYYAEAPQKMDFVWHGGEPLLHEAAYYKTIFSLQQRYLDAVGIPFQNSIQTNLAVLDEQTIEFLRHNFENIGVSVDLFGDLRLNAAGNPSQPKVLENMQRLLDAEVRFGCITVLSRPTVGRVREIFDFFHELGIAFRLLPIYRTGFQHQHDEFGITDVQIVEAFQQVTDLWFEMDGLLQVRPIQDYVSNVLRYYAGPPLQNTFYSRHNEILFIVDTDGSVYSNADAYCPEYCYGNIFRNSMTELLDSPGYRATLSSRVQRMKDTCQLCRFHGACSGFFIGEATPEQRYLDEAGGLKCAIALPLHRYIEQKLAQHGIIDIQRRRLDRSRLPALPMEEPATQAAEF